MIVQNLLYRAWTKRGLVYIIYTGLRLYHVKCKYFCALTDKWSDPTSYGRQKTDLTSRQRGRLAAPQRQDSKCQTIPPNAPVGTRHQHSVTVSRDVTLSLTVTSKGKHFTVKDICKALVNQSEPCHGGAVISRSIPQLSRGQHTFITALNP
jgi:hypothetical protein